MATKIDIGGELNPRTVEGIVADASTIIDRTAEKRQDEINSEVSESLEGKQGVIADLETIRSGAASGSTAIQPTQIEDVVRHVDTGALEPLLDPSDYATTDQLNQLGQEVEGMVEDSQVDFAISDGNGYDIAQFAEGHIKTKNFDSIKSPQAEDVDDCDLDFRDKDNNVLVRFKDGHIQTKKFDSSIIDVAQSIIGRYAGKVISILGDSISTFGDPSATNENGTYCYSYYPETSCRYSVDGVDSIEFDVNDTYWMRLTKATGMMLGVNDSYRGTKVSGTTNAFNLQTRINHLGENGTPNVILVFGGTNDAGGNVTIGTFDTTNPQNYTDAEIAALPVTTFADGYRTMLIRLMKTYPLAEIVVVLPTFTTSYYTITNLDLYVELIKEACDFFGIKYIDARCTGINVYNRATYLVDGIHPNKRGMELLFNKIYKHLIFD